MVRVRRDALEAVDGGLLERLDVLVTVVVREDADRLALRDERGEVARRARRRPPDRRPARRRRCLDRRPQRGLHGGALADDAREMLGVEVHVGDRREERLRREDVGRVIDDADLGTGDRESRDALELVQQQILQRRDLAVLPHTPTVVHPTPLLVCSHWLQNMVSPFVDGWLAVSDRRRSAHGGRSGVPPRVPQAGKAARTRRVRAAEGPRRGLSERRDLRGVGAAQLTYPWISAGRHRVQTHSLRPCWRTGSSGAWSSSVPHRKHTCGMYVFCFSAMIGSAAS